VSGRRTGRAHPDDDEVVTVSHATCGASSRRTVRVCAASSGVPMSTAE
jgi:hypothetical protein